MAYTVGSLFSGALDGLGLAFSIAGYEVLFHVEFDDWRRKVLEKHAPQFWPNSIQHKDVKQVGAHNLPYVDILAGGFPCVDVSYPGKRAGLDEGTRSGLWHEFRRIISELRPRVVIVENVTGLLTLGGSTVIADLAGLGYVGRWGVISASDAGATQQRERVFIVAYTECVGGYERRRERSNSPARTEQGKATIGRGHSNQVARLNQNQLGRSGQFQSRLNQSRLARSAHGLSRRVDFPGFPATPKQKQHAYEPPRTIAGKVADRKERIAALGDGVVWQCVYPIAVSVKQLLTAQDAERVA